MQRYIVEADDCVDLSEEERLPVRFFNLEYFGEVQVFDEELVGLLEKVGLGGWQPGLPQPLKLVERGGDLGGDIAE